MFLKVLNDTVHEIITCFDGEKGETATTRVMDSCFCIKSANTGNGI